MSIIDELIEEFKREGISVGVHCDTSKQDYSVRGRSLAYQRRYNRRMREKQKQLNKK